MHTKPRAYQRFIEAVRSWKVRVEHYPPLGEAALALRDAIYSSSGAGFTEIEELTVDKFNAPTGIELIKDRLNVPLK